MYDPNAPTIEIRVLNDDLQYQLRPKYLPSQKAGEQPIIYLDPEDPGSFSQTVCFLDFRCVSLYFIRCFGVCAGFYERKIIGTPDRPVLTCWILIKNTRWVAGGYVKRRLAEEMRRQNIQVSLVHPMRCDLLVSKDGLENIVVAGEKVPLPDCVIPRVGAAVDYFGLAIMRQLETLNVLVFNPSPAIEIARDKLYTHQIMATNGIPM